MKATIQTNVGGGDQLLEAPPVEVDGTPADVLDVVEVELSEYATDAELRITIECVRP